MTDLVTLNNMWTSERERYDKYAVYVGRRLRAKLVSKGLSCPVYSRAKDAASLLRKALEKDYQDAWSEITDKAGVRVVAPFPESVRDIEYQIEATFEVIERQDKLEVLGIDKLGYLGVHYLVRPKGRNQFSGMICEIQIQTRAQSLWADASHTLWYKSIVEPPVSISRRILRLIALVELFDSEVRACRGEIMSLNDYEEAGMLDALERAMIQLAPQHYDRELSLHILRPMKCLYSAEELKSFGPLVEAFVHANRDKLRALHNDYRSASTANVLLHQPESLAFFERLERDSFRLKDCLTPIIPAEFLENLADVWGRPF